MRDVLRKRVRQQVERLVEDMTELAVRRVEAELERMGEAFGVALSAFASEERHADSDRGNHPVPRVRRSARRGLHRDDGRGPRRTDSGDVDGQDAQQPAQAPDPAPVRRAPVNKGQKTICRKCGYVGGNARGCGTAHPTIPAGTVVLEVDSKPVAAWDTFSVAPPRVSASQPKRDVSGKEGSSHGAAGPVRSAATPDRRAAIAALATKPPAPRPQADERGPDAESDVFEDDEPLADRIARAEASKREGELPRPRSSFDLEHTGGKYADVRELDFGGDAEP